MVGQQVALHRIMGFKLLNALFQCEQVIGMRPVCMCCPGNQNSNGLCAAAATDHFCAAHAGHIQVLDLSTTPDLETPQYSVLRVTNDYEVRRYAPFVVAEAPMGPGSSECAHVP